MIQARSKREIPGMGPGRQGVVYDYRGTGLCPPNGGRIRPLVMVHHIPVVRNVKGVGDGIQLGNILREKRLAIQAATDSEGNVFLYTRFDELCYGHRGLNQQACGVEHMHWNIGEAWEKWQMRAAAWCANQVWQSYNIAPHRALLDPGPGYVRVRRRGHTSHKTVAAKAGYHDRSDPGPGFRFAELYELTKFYARRRRF